MAFTNDQECPRVTLAMPAATLDSRHLQGASPPHDIQALAITLPELDIHRLLAKPNL